MPCFYPVAMLRPIPLALLGLALAVGCGGSSESFSETDGEAGEPGSGGSISGSGGTQGGSVNGGTSGTGAGGTDPNGGTGVGGTETGGEAGVGATGGSSGLGGTSGFGGSAGFPTGGFGGQVGGSGGFGGAPDPLCPFRPPSGACDPNGLQCRYDLARQCLCVSFSTIACTAFDPRCTVMAGALPPSGDIAIPVSTQTCTCQGGMWFCTYP